jgi:hypothetical protein
MVRTTIDLTPESRLEPEPLAVGYGRERAVGLVRVRDGGGVAVVMGALAELGALAATATRPAEPAEGMSRVAELLAAAGITERGPS